MKINNRSTFARFFVFVLFFCASAISAQSASAANVSGEAWSGNIGWIKFAGTALDGTPYGVNIDTSNGAMSGYAWSEHIGAISFEVASLAGCPSGACEAEVSMAPVSGKYHLSGWARACSVFQSGCSGALKDPSELGGWDGWIKLSGTAEDGTPYGWYIDSSGDFHGYIYGASASGDPSTGVIGFVSANCLEGSASGGSVCAVSNYKVHTTATFAPVAAMSCDPASTAANCPGGICDNTPGMAWQVYIPNGNCTTCSFTAINNSTGNITQTTWEVLDSGGNTVFTTSSNSNPSPNFTFPLLNIPTGAYTLRLTVSNGVDPDSSVTRAVNIRRDIIARQQCTFDGPYLVPLTDPPVANPSRDWLDCGDADFKSKVIEGERIYLNDASTGSDSGAGPTVIVGRLWTLTNDLGTSTNSDAMTEFVAGKTNVVTLRVSDSNSPMRTCTTSTNFGGKSLPEWQEVGPIGTILQSFVAGISRFFAAF